MASITAGGSTLAAMEESLLHVVLCFIPPRSTFVLAAMRLGHIPQLLELHQDASEGHSCPLRHRRLIRRHHDEQDMATTVIG